MLMLILSLWIAQSVPVLPLGTELAPEPVIAHQTAACCCGEKCECGDACQCQKPEDGKSCCQHDCKCCSKKVVEGDAKAHACCAGHDQKTGDEAKAQKCCGAGTHCKHHAKPGR
jgi:hypothetical protein